jgi:hypothetical protein
VTTWDTSQLVLEQFQELVCMFRCETLHCGAVVVEAERGADVVLARVRANVYACVLAYSERFNALSLFL